MPGHSRRKDGVASACLCPGHPFTLPPPGEGNRIWNFPMPSARDFFRFCVTFQRVVPANAGTHTPCLLVLALGQIPSATSKARGYGSLRSQGRPAESLCEAATASTRGSIQAICDSPALAGGSSSSLLQRGDQCGGVTFQHFSVFLAARWRQQCCAVVAR